MLKVSWTETAKLKKPCVITIGMFDGVHIGHQKMLEELTSCAKNLRCSSIVITFTNHPRQILDKDNSNPVKLLQTTQERFSKIASYGVDYIIPITFTKQLASFSPKQFLDFLLEKLDIKLLLLGYDNRFGNPNNNEYEELLEEGQYRMVKIQKDISGIYYKDIEVSSTQIRKAIANGEISLANTMLKGEYSITSVVVKGLQNGTKIGFPTANISLPCDKIVPKSGVYATKTIIDGAEYNSVTNIGNNPTFNAQNTTIETYIIDFNSDIYGKEITVKFIEFLREEIKFANIEDLTAQMKIDLADAKKILA